MQIRLTHTQLLRYAGLFTWAVVGVPLLLYGWYPELLPAVTSVSKSVLAYMVFGVTYWLLTRELGVRRPRSFDVALLALLTLSAIAFSKYTGSGLGSILLMLVSGVIPWLVPLSVGVTWLIVAAVPAVAVYERLCQTRRLTRLNEDHAAQYA